MSAPKPNTDSPKSKSVLVIEDSEGKWLEVEQVLQTFNGLSVVRAETLNEAEYFAVSADWDLVILDISMDISANAAGKRIGHDPLGGLQVANKMFLLGHESPTLILTAFDSFPSGDGGRRGAQILGLEDVEAKAADILGTSFLGCIRYGGQGWQANFSASVKKALHQ